MATIRYIGKFGSDDGNVYQVRLHDSTFDGSATEFPLKSVAFIRGRRGTDVFTPIRASSTELVGYKLTTSALDELLGADVGRFTMEIWRGSSHAVLDADGGTMYWKGIVQTDLGEDDTARAISTINITATDGLSLLRDVKFLDTSGEIPIQYLGRMTHLETIRECLAKIGYSIPVSVSGIWYPDAGESGDVLWEHAEVDHAIFYNEKGAPASCYEVLKQILYPYGGILFWREGRFVIVQKSQIGAGTYTTNDYDENGEDDGESTYGNTVNSDAAYRLKGSRIFKPAHGGLTVVYNHGNLPSLIQAGNFLVDSLWSFGASGGEIRGSGGTRVRRPLINLGSLNLERIQIFKVGFIPAFFYGSDTSFEAFRDAIKASDRYITQTGGEAQEGDIIAFAARFRLPYNAGDGDGLYNTFFELQIGSNADAYLSRDGTWFTPSGSDDLQPLRIPEDEYNETGFALSRDPGEGWYDVTIISEPVPYTGEVRLVLYGTADENGSFLDPEGVEWADVAVLIVDEDGELRDSIAFSGVTTSPEPVDKDLVLLAGQGPHPAAPGGVTWDGEAAENWTDGEVTPENLSQLLVRTRLGFQSGRLEVRYETYNGLDYEMGDPLQIDGELYDVVFNEKDLASKDDTIEAVRIAYDDSDITFTESNEDIADYVPSGGGSTSVISSPSSTSSLDGIITNKGDLIVGDGEGEPAAFSTGEEDGQVMVTDGEADSGWSLQELTPITTKGDLIVGDGEGNPVRLPVPADGFFWLADSTRPLGWRAVSISSFGTLGEIYTDYLPDDNVHRWTTTAKAAKLTGSGTKSGFAWLVTVFPDEMIDSDESTSEASGAPTLRAALDPLGTSPIAIDVQDFTPASGGHGGGATARVWLDPGPYECGEDFPVTFFWITGGSQTQPASDEDYGSDSVYPDYGGAWELAEDPSGSAPQVLDKTGNGNHGTSYGSMTDTDQIDFMHGTGLDLDGSNDAIQIPDDASLQFNADTGLSFGLWINEDSQTGWRTYFGKRQNGLGGTYGQYLLNKNQGSDILQLSFIDGSGVHAVSVSWSAEITPGVDYMVGCVLEESGSDTILRLYKDGVLLDTATILGVTIGSNTAPLCIGAAKYSAGSIDEECGMDVGFPFVMHRILDADEWAHMHENQSDPADFWDTTASVEDGPFI